MRTIFRTPIAAAIAAAMLATSLPAVPAFASGKQQTLAPVSVDLSARKRHYRSGNAAAARAFAGVAGAIIGMAAVAATRRDDYPYGYGYGGYGYYGSPYAAPPAYGYYRRW